MSRLSRLPSVACREPVWPTYRAEIVAPGRSRAAPGIGRGDQLDIGIPEEGDRGLGRPHPGRDDVEHRALHVKGQDDQPSGGGLALAGDGTDGHVAVFDRGAEGHGGGRAPAAAPPPPRRWRRRHRTTRARRPRRRRGAPPAPVRAPPDCHVQLAGTLGDVGGDRVLPRSRRGGEAQPVTFTGTDTPQNRSVINMSEMAMATVLVRMARPVARPTPSGPPDAVIP